MKKQPKSLVIGENVKLKEEAVETLCFSERYLMGGDQGKGILIRIVLEEHCVIQFFFDNRICIVPICLVEASSPPPKARRKRGHYNVDPDIPPLLYPLSLSLLQTLLSVFRLTQQGVRPSLSDIVDDLRSSYRAIYKRVSILAKRKILVAFRDGVLFRWIIPPPFINALRSYLLRKQKRGR